MTESSDGQEVSVEEDRSVDSSASDLYSMFQRENELRVEKYRAYAGSSYYTKHLETALEALLESATFDVGDLVQWKTFLRNVAFPEYGVPAIVVKLTPGTVSVDAAEGAKDIVMGYLDADQDLVLVHTESRRLMAWDITDTSE